MNAELRRLAMFGGTPSVPESLRSWEHPMVAFPSDAAGYPGLNIVRYDGGGVIDKVEQAFRAWHGRRFALTFNSGTSALYSMYYGAGLGEGDEVIVPRYTFFATATPLLRLGCRPVLADALDDGNIDPWDVERKITSRTRAVVCTHMWGVPCDMRRLVDVCSRYELDLFEDCSHAHGALYEGKLVGTFGRASAFSLGAKKLISGGQGGILMTDDVELHQRAVLVGHYNDRGTRDITLAHLRPFAVTGTGMNLRMHPMAAVLVLSQLACFKEWSAEREETRQYLTKSLADVAGVKVPTVSVSVVPANYALALTYEPAALGVSREVFLAALRSEGADDVDVPGTTRPLEHYQTFRDETAGGVTTAAAAYHERVLKLPVWSGTRRLEYAAAYTDAFKKVASNAKVLRNSVEKKLV